MDMSCLQRCALGQGAVAIYLTKSEVYDSLVLYDSPGG